MVCEKGTPQRNAPLLACQADFAFQHGFMPLPYQLFEHLIRGNHAAIVRE